MTVSRAIVVSLPGVRYEMQGTALTINMADWNRLPDTCDVENLATYALNSGKES